MRLSIGGYKFTYTYTIYNILEQVLEGCKTNAYNIIFEIRFSNMMHILKLFISD